MRKMWVLVGAAVLVAVTVIGGVVAMSHAKRATPAAPELVDACRDWFPLTEAGRLDAPESWGGSTLLGAAPLGSPDVIVVFGRHGGPEILSSELARLAHLATLAASIGHPAPTR